MSAAPVSTLTLVIGDEFTVTLAYPDEEGGVITFGNLWTPIHARLGEDFNLERLVFYDREYRHIPFGYDAQPVEHSFVRAMIMNENLLSFYYQHLIPFLGQGPSHSTTISTWPWVMTEADEAWIATRMAEEEEYLRQEQEEQNE